MFFVVGCIGFGYGYGFGGVSVFWSRCQDLHFSHIATGKAHVALALVLALVLSVS